MKLTAAEQASLDNVMAAVKESRIVIDDAAPTHIAGLRSRLKMLKRLHKIELAIVDYYQLMCGNDPKARRYDQLVEVSRGLKILANDLDIPIIILAQLNAEGQSAERSPRITDIEECKRLFKDANVFVLLDRPYERNKYAATCSANPLAGTMDVAAIRSGEPGIIHAQYEGAIQRWTTDGQGQDQHTMAYEGEAMQ
jgi:replicative DNA helicase